MEIETVTPEPSKFPVNRLWLIYGAPKTGKTTFANTWDKPLFFDLENGTNDIECVRVRPKTLKEFQDNLKDPELENYNTIIIDSIDLVFNFLERLVIGRLNKQLKTNYSFIGQFPNGLGWSSVRNAMKSWIFEFIVPITQSDKNVLFIAHEKSEIVKREGKEDKTRYGINIPGQTAGVITSLSDVVGRVHIKGGKHMISFSPARDLGGSRIKAIAGRDIPLSIKVLRTVISKYVEKKPQGMKEIAEDLEE
jgi:hypothetical protein